MKTLSLEEIFSNQRRIITDNKVCSEDVDNGFLVWWEGFLHSTIQQNPRLGFPKRLKFMVIATLGTTGYKADIQGGPMWRSFRRRSFGFFHLLALAYAETLTCAVT